ncbi:hypothetical protein [Bacillus niameyensis]|uniref:hypothetical protein n=1 Tax=Bacillus niameyensis TaxID=1522308 RepID=UPI000782F7B7|nr:hypothetical protein [Bacillus niameyensis]
MNQSEKSIKEALEQEIFQNSPFDASSKKRILQHIENKRGSTSWSPFQRLIPLVLSFAVSIGIVFAIGSFVYGKLSGDPQVIPHSAEMQNEEGPGTAAEDKNLVQSQEKTFQTYGIDPATVGAAVYADLSGFYPLTEKPFATHHNFPLIDLSYTEITETKFLMTGSEIESVHQKFPEVSVWVPAGIYYNDELIQVAVVVGSESDLAHKEEITKEFQKLYPNISIAIIYSNVVAETSDQHILVPYSFGYGLNDYTYVQDLVTATYSDNVETTLDLAKTNQQFVDKTNSLGANDLSDTERAYKTLTFGGYFLNPPDQFNTQGNEKKLLAGHLGIFSEIPLNRAGQEEAVRQLIAEIENYYETSDFGLVVNYHLNPLYLNGKSEEEYGGWTIGYKMPNHPEIYIRHFEGEDIYAP